MKVEKTDNVLVKTLNQCCSNTENAQIDIKSAVGCSVEAITVSLNSALQLLYKSYVSVFNKLFVKVFIFYLLELSNGLIK